MKSVLISIKPKWVEKISSGEKTIEVRKTRPKIETPFKCYIYCTNNRNQAFYFEKKACNGLMAITGSGKGKVIGEFVCDEITQFGNNFFLPSMLWIEKEACLSGEDICKYLGEKESGFAWHISDLKIYDKPKELGEFKNHCRYELDDDFKHCYGCDYHYYSNTPSSGIEEYCSCDGLKTLTRPPQSYMFVESLGE